MSNRPVHLVGSGPHDTATPDVYTSSERYAQRFSGAVGRWLLERQAAGVRKLVDAASAAKKGARLRILEVCGGHAQLTGELLDAGHEVVVHGSPAACFDRVRARHGSHPRLKGSVASSLWRLPFGDHAFDVVIAVRVMAHVRAWQALLAEMGRVSERWMVVEFPRTHELGERKLGRLLFAMKKRLERSTRPFYTYDEHAVRGGLAEAGYRVRDVDAQFALPMVLHRTLRAPRVSHAVEEALVGVGAGVRHRSPVLLLAERAVGVTAGVSAPALRAEGSSPVASGTSSSR